MKHILFLISLFISVLSYGQRDLVSSGGDATGSGGSVSYSIGQVAYESASGANGNINQGVQQPFEIFVVLSNPELGDSFSATLYPNPAATSVILALDLAKEGSNLVYELSDITGKIIRNGRITSNETIINVEGFAEACYFLNVLEGNSRVKTFKLLKNN
jgi:hypothetical protein